MTNKIVEINNQTNFRGLMDNANCETRLHRVGSELEYFKFKDKSTKKWFELNIGDKIFVDNDNNFKIIN